MQRTGNSLLSPHNSVIQALQNPELEMSQAESPNEFSSWQSIGHPASPHLVVGVTNNTPNSVLSSDDDEEAMAFDFEERVVVEDTASTVKESVPSFIMPRVSMSESGNVVRVQVLGSHSELLIRRLQFYKKKFLKNCEFTNNDPHLVLLVVDSENYVLPKLMNKPFIPIVLEETHESEEFEDVQSRSFFTSSMVCDPIVLKSIDQDLFGLINFLSNLDYRTFNSTMTLVSKYSFEKNGMSLDQLNSLILDQQSDSLRKSVRRKSKDHSEQPDDLRSLKLKLLIGATVGCVSLTCVYLWRELTASPAKSVAPPVKIDTAQSYWDKFRDLFIGSALYFVNRTKIAISHILQLTEPLNFYMLD